MSTRRIDTHEEPWLREALDELLADEPPPAPAAIVVDDVRRGQVALALVRRRRAATGAVAAMLVAVAVPVGVVLRVPPDAGAPPSSSHSPAVDAAPWTPADGYAATSQELQRRVVALLPAGVTAVPAPVATDCMSPLGCPAAVRFQLSSADGSGFLTVGATTGGSDPMPDRCGHSLMYGQTCTVLLPWTRVGDVVVGAARSEYPKGRCGDSWLVVRGSTVVAVSLVPPAAGPGCPTPLDKGAAAAPVLTQDQLRALALAVPLPVRLAAYVDALPHSPTPAATGATTTSAPPTSGDQAAASAAASAAAAAADAEQARRHPCRASDLAVTLDSHDGAGGTTFDWYAFRNTSGSACGLTGFPTLARGGAALPFTIRYGVAQGPLDPVPVPTAPVLVEPGARALSLVSSYRCDVGEAGALAGLGVTVPGDPTRIPLPSSRQPVCVGGPTAPGNEIDVSAFYRPTS